MSDSPDILPDAAVPMSRSRKFIVPLGIVGMIVLLAAGVFALKFQHSAAINPGDTTVTLAPPADWQTYRDPGGYFTMRMPADWQNNDVGHGQFGNTKAGVFFDQTIYTFGPNPQSNHQISLSVMVSPLLSAQQRQYTCKDPQLTFPAKRPIGKLSAYYNDDVKEYMLYAQGAYFMIQYNYAGLPVFNPGGPALTSIPPTPTSVPAAQLRASQIIINTILASFTPIPDAPLAC